MKRLVLFAAALLFVLGMAAPANAAGTDISIGANITILGYYKDNYDFDDDKPDAVADITERVKIFLYNSYTDNVKTTIRMDAKTSDATKPGIEVDRAFIEMKEFLNDNVTFRIGKITWSWEWRKKFGAGTLYELANGELESMFVLKLRPIGFDVKYAFSKTNSFTLGWGKAKEASVAGNNANDIDAFILRYDHKLEDGKFFAGFLFYNDNYAKGGTPPTTLPGDIWYLNFGVDYFLSEEALELYLEFSYQGGDPHDSNYDFGALAANLGAEYTFKDSEVVPYIGIDINYYQGVDGDTYGYVRYNTNFNRTLIAESDFFKGLWKNDYASSGMYAGGTAKSNYRGGYTGIKLNAGMKSLMNDKAGLDVILGFFTANGDMPASNIDKGLGIEFDVIMSYYYTEDVTFIVGLGYFDPDEDLGGADADAVLVAVFGCSIIF